MDIFVPSAPKYLLITQTMIEDLMWDPVMAAEVIMGYKLDIFQRCRLKYYWWTPFVIDYSGIDSGKSLCAWISINLRCLLMPDHWSLVYYQTFDAMKGIFWPYYRKTIHPIWRANLGELDMGELTGKREKHNTGGKSTKKDPGCYIAMFRNESRVFCPSPGFITGSKSQAGRRANDLYVDEFTKAETMTIKANGIDDQLMTRINRSPYNQYHCFWTNHMLFTASAEDTSHPSDKRVRAYERAIALGCPDHAFISWSFKDWSDFPCHTGKSFRDEFRIEANLKELRAKKTPARYLTEVLGVRSKIGSGFYTPAIIRQSQRIGLERKLFPIMARTEDPHQPTAHYFLGVDSAPAQTATAADGAFAIMRAMPAGNHDSRTFSNNPADWARDWIYARRFRNATIRQWSGLIHHLNDRFGFARIGLDHGPGGGGGFIRAELAMSRQLVENQEVECRPIVRPEDSQIINGQFILVMFGQADHEIAQFWPDAKNGYDVLLDYAHSALNVAMSHNGMGLMDPDWSSENVAGKSEEYASALEILTKTMPSQLKEITFAINSEGEVQLTSHNVRQFMSKGKKDFVSAMLHAYTGFMAWLKSNENFEEQSDEDSVGFLQF